jgi:glycine/D-amino acid oxidase-like deaminating enzyme
VGHHDAVIAGGGVIGLSRGWLASRDGLEIFVVDAGVGTASDAAIAMGTRL